MECHMGGMLENWRDHVRGRPRTRGTRSGPEIGS